MARILINAAAVVAIGCASPALAGDLATGAKVFRTNCAVCHSTGNNAVVGPGLHGLVGRKAGSVPGFSYSAAMKSAGFAWTAEQLAKYVTNPQAVVKGNRMPFSGLQNRSQAVDLVAYLETLR